MGDFVIVTFVSAMIQGVGYLVVATIGYSLYKSVTRS